MMSENELASMFAALDFDPRDKAVVNSAIESLSEPERVFGGAINSTIDMVGDVINTTAALEWLAGIELGKILYGFQDDQVCDEPLRCPYFTDTNDCTESLAENAMDAYAAAVRSRHQR